MLAAVNGVTLSVRRGETLGLVGESGCGKSTVARLIAGLHTPSRGSIVFAGTTLAGSGVTRDARQLRQVRRSMQMIFQDPHASLNPRWRVATIVAEPLTMVEPPLGRAAIAAKVGELLAAVGLDTLAAAKFPHQFSGGQRQRISIARALASAPAFIVCDEPTSALDVSVQAQVLNLMRDLQLRMGLTYLFISHNLAVVRHSADRVGVMYLGRIVELASTEALFAAPAHPYTRMLMDAVPDAGMRREGGARDTGEVPDAIHPPAGCTFHPRCPWANARCQAESPALLPDAGGALVACHAVAEGRLPAWRAIAA